MTESTFQALPLAEPIQRAILDKGYTCPSPIQAAAILPALQGRDLLACAQTGTGKTAAFALPLLHRLQAMPGKPTRGEVRALVLTPTRELAVQVEESFRTYGRHLRLSTALVHGGVSMHPQKKALFRGVDVLVATPGRLLDLFNQRCMDLSGVQYLVLDEADRMLDMGFINDIRKIVRELPVQRQTLLFSATMAPEVSALAAGILKNPEEIRIAPQGTTAENINQQVLFVSRENKTPLLISLVTQMIDMEQKGLSLVFSRTRHGARRLAQHLNRAGIRADAIHGDKTQAARQKTLDRFRDGHTPVLVATDVAARGIDVPNITLVVNYDLPEEADGYVHRIGRTARAGASGRALSFCSAEETKYLRGIEKLTRNAIPVDSQHEFHLEGLADGYLNGERSGGRPRPSFRKGGKRGNRSPRAHSGFSRGSSNRRRRRSQAPR